MLDKSTKHLCFIESGMYITTEKTLLINAYLPHDNGENIDDYLSYLGKIYCLMSDYSTSNSLIVGDFTVPAIR